jgi:hypothetical protein
MQPTDAIVRGKRILGPVFHKHLFHFVAGPAGKGSGGKFATGAYVRWRRRFEFHFRYSLGLVTYRWGDISLSHEDYMWAVLGRQGGNEFPGFDADPLHQFQNLRHDLERYCQAFLSGSAQEFRELASLTKDRPKGFAALG